MKDWHRKSESQAGFSLLELLIAMTPVGFLMVLVYGGLHLGSRVWERAEKGSTSLDETSIAQTLLRRALETAYPYFATDSPLGAHVDFEGTENSIKFLASAPMSVSIGRARIIVQRASRDDAFELFVSMRNELAADAVPAQNEVLLRNLTELTFSYYGSQKPDDPPSWTTNWVNQTHFPTLVRISAAFKDPTRIWPELTVAPRIAADVGCIYDVLINRCRGR